MSYTSQIPDLDAGHVTATTRYSDAHYPHFACNPASSLTGDSEWDTWAAAEYNLTNQTFKIYYGAGKTIKRIYYENFFDQIDWTYIAGVRNFTFWGSNDDANWTQLVCSQSYFNEHVHADQADPQYITVDNNTSFTVYKFIFADNWGSEVVMGVRRIELQTEDAAPPPSGVPPTVVTSAITGITDEDADGGGDCTHDGGGTVSAKGVCWSTAENPTTADAKTNDGTGEGSFASSLTGLTAPTTYYVRAYATNEYGTGYGTQVSFSTVALPTVTTTSPASKIKNTNANVRGAIVSTGGVAPTTRGVCYNTTGSPTTADSKVYETGTFAVGSFSEALTGLTRSTLYYARAYAINSEGTAYGAEISFTTLSVESIADPQLRLADTFYLPRAGRYADPQNTNDMLPLVYGDHTDGATGIWQLPCIDTVNFVYCFCAFPVLSVANGNSINVYADGVLVDPANYTFDEDNDFESEGQIATVTFTSDQENAVITARGKGKMLTGTTLMENIIDIVSDFLTVQNNFTSDLFEATAKAKATQVFNAQGYAASGVIMEDGVIWDIITGMMASFIGSAYLNGSGELVLEIDNGAMSLYGATIIRKGEATVIDARQRLVNIINQCPVHYAYNYAEGEFKKETNTAAHADAISQGVHGVREPNEPMQLYWCRNITDAQAMQDIIVGKFKDPIYEIEIEDSSLKRLHLDVGDMFVHSVDSLYGKDGNSLGNNYWRTISVRPDFSKAKINFRALQTPYYLTLAYLADGTYLANGSILAGNNRDTVVY